MAANEAADLEQALLICIHDVCIYTGWQVGEAVFIDDEGRPPISNVQTIDPERFASVIEASRKGDPTISISVARALESGRPSVGQAGGPDADDTSRSAAAMGLDTVIASRSPLADR